MKLLCGLVLSLAFTGRIEAATKIIPGFSSNPLEKANANRKRMVQAGLRLFLGRDHQVNFTGEGEQKGTEIYYPYQTDNGKKGNLIIEYRKGTKTAGRIYIEHNGLERFAYRTILDRFDSLQMALQMELYKLNEPRAFDAQLMVPPTYLQDEDNGEERASMGFFFGKRANFPMLAGTRFNPFQEADGPREGHVLVDMENKRNKNPILEISDMHGQIWKKKRKRAKAGGAKQP